ncbi:MAG: glycoside hydrolase family 172 protein [bacterium]
MNNKQNFGPNLSSLPHVTDAETRSISAENPTGEKGNGAQAKPDGEGPAANLGQGWKVRPCITLKPESTTTIAEIEGPALIQHIWITVSEEAYRDCIIRFYWDDEEEPSIEVPLGDFFANGHGLRYNVNSIPVTVNPSGGFNCYWQMPFQKNAKITIENQKKEDIAGFFYQVTYSLQDIPDNAAYFHAQWRRSMTTRENPEHVIVDDIKGQGHYVGTFLAWTQFSDGWWGEGEVKFYLDGDDEYPTICGTGTEDYFGGAWCFDGETYSTPYLGYPLYEKEEGQVPKHGLYRWHIQDPIRFQQDLKVTVQALGWWPEGKYEPLTDDISSVAYWYQLEPHSSFPQFPAREERWPRK